MKMKTQKKETKQFITVRAKLKRVNKAESGEQSVLAHLLAVFTFSLFVGLSLLHLTMVWQRFKYGEMSLVPAPSLEQLMARYYAFEEPSPVIQPGLRVNTSYFMH